MKFYTAFIYDDYETAKLHCTHKYLGEQSPESIEEVIKQIEDYLEPDFQRPPVIRFDGFKVFGGHKVLTAESEKFAADNLYPSLRQTLAEFKSDDYGGYRPHVTTDSLLPIERPFAYYALMSKDTVIRKWAIRD